VLYENSIQIKLAAALATLATHPAGISGVAATNKVEAPNNIIVSDAKNS
jgi:hypothetical protein